MDSATTDCLLCACLRAHIPFYRRHTVSAVSSLRSAKKGIFGGAFLLLLRLLCTSDRHHLNSDKGMSFCHSSLFFCLYVRMITVTFFPASHHEHKPFLSRTIKAQFPLPVGAPPYWICHCFSQIYEVTYEPFLFSLCVFLWTAGVS